MLSRATLAAARAARSTSTSEPPSADDVLAASADSRTTVRIVPSIGFSTAWYAPAGRGGERFGDLVPAVLGTVLEGRREAAEDLAQDHAAVAAGAHERAVADGVARGVEILGRSVLHLGHHGVEGARHVGAGVAVGNRVHVEAIEPARVLAHGVAERGDDLPEGMDVEPVERGHVARLTVPTPAAPVRVRANGTDRRRRVADPPQAAEPRSRVR